jgi:hypothetical protein
MRSWPWDQERKDGHIWLPQNADLEEFARTHTDVVETSILSEFNPSRKEVMTVWEMPKSGARRKWPNTITANG